MRLLFVLLSLFIGLVSMADGHVLKFKGKNGAVKGKAIVLISGDEEYRSEEAMPMLAKILSQYHGFDCKVLFSATMTVPISTQITRQAFGDGENSKQPI